MGLHSPANEGVQDESPRVCASHQQSQTFAVPALVQLGRLDPRSPSALCAYGPGKSALADPAQAGGWPRRSHEVPSQLCCGAAGSRFHQVISPQSALN